MKTSFEVIKHSKMNSDGCNYEYYIIKKKIFGITYRVTDIGLLSDNAFSTMAFITLGISNFMLMVAIACNEISISYWWTLLTSIASCFIVYFISPLRFSNLEYAEDYIKTHLKKKNFKSSTESVLKYNIDMGKGVFEKETSAKQLN